MKNQDVKEIIKKELKEVELPLIVDENSIKEYIYEIRGERVMLDFDLAKIYGYETKAFNQQVKRNIEKFEGKEFMFRLNRKETDILSRSQFVTLNEAPRRGENVKYLPYAFTEQGVYMLMTVLRGELATKQSRALCLAFTALKDYYIETNNLLSTSGIIDLVDRINKNENDIKGIKEDNEEIRNQLVKVMDYFYDPSKHKNYLIMNNQRIEADVAYKTIYKIAKHSIVIIDNYINEKTLELLKEVDTKVNITIVSDNVNKMPDSSIDDFNKDTGRDITIIKPPRPYHDRYILVDFYHDTECIYHSGPSSKDAGNAVATISELGDHEYYRPLFYEIMKNK